MTHIKNIRKQTDNKFLNLYELDFTDRQGTDRNYYFVTRNDDDHIKIRTHALDPEGIVIYAVTKDFLANVDVRDVAEYEKELYLYLDKDSVGLDVMRTISSTGKLEEETEAKLVDVLKAFTDGFTARKGKE